MEYLVGAIVGCLIMLVGIATGMSFNNNKDNSQK